jgi:hypothetical protein
VVKSFIAAVVTSTLQDSNKVLVKSD